MSCVRLLNSKTSTSSSFLGKNRSSLSSAIERRRVCSRTPALAPGFQQITLPAAPHGSATEQHVLHKAQEVEEWIINTRRLLHQTPELSFQEYKTSSIIQRRLQEMGVAFEAPVARTGVVAQIGSGSPVVVLRADMDALPIVEDTGLPFCSLEPGCMHACGHDCHMAIALGAARILKDMERKGELAPGTIKLVFQPAEEADGGGKVMVEEGVLQGADAAFALHVWPALPVGTLATRPGPLMAGVLSFEATITGRGGHAAMPQFTTNPVIAAASIASSLRALVTAALPPYEPVVVNVCHISGGEAFNVVPDKVAFGGTVRAFSDSTMTHLRERLSEVVATQAAVHGCSGEVDFREDKEPYFPPLVNDPDATDFARSVAKKVFGEHNVKLADLTMASEDFAFIAQAVPSCFAFLGVRNEAIGAIHGLHSPMFTVDEGALRLGAAYMASLAVDYLRDTAEKEEEAQTRL
mmetsp:Transcript_15881/g.34266  ORF Transcript_15881/g.34266 Transcript_15881/m.34266 type:complete len:466 (+) Transcript_15881:146-1543(+)|eukprot:CAMPEP_0202903678 /NCGR_PEP_ID=MMETSP1392-20130828/25730_1 /ASSEMBLY_ACC=CAM_ASM_000868 /TAXON_ID=225041 /ORGANISM="Chlamydomonas chlamydogama, Strain SAG 11-48b" /LENGTH=465 /DNA_ID=CAMNT_0049590975 /DNA_START=111 /DNA_END=1508 /DNA_ORIENTATION=-